MSEQTQPRLAVRNLTTVFHTRAGRFVAVDDISFDVYPGECLGIVGESGSGKSVAALSIMGLVDYPGQIEAGRIEYAGTDLRTLSENQLRRVRGEEIGIIFQDPQTSLNPLFTVGTQLVDVVRAHRKISKSEAAALAIEKMKLVGISAPESRMKSYPWELSGGQRQRIAIAMALLLGPKLIIADEPTTALDVSIQAQIVDLLISLKNELDFSLIFVSHDLGVIQNVANRVMVMYAGRMMETGEVGSLFRDPYHPYTAALLASAPTLRTNRSEPLQAIDGRLPSPGKLPPGCVFAPRCQYVQEDCRVRQPLLESIGDAGRRVACIHPLIALPDEVHV
ncbi:MAG: ABC transporter ATP-binding protein [Thermomicrobiales bacterium]|nr:ABC transporter ATP-binding protein [Thermomicrobiales bacterium]